MTFSSLIFLYLFLPIVIIGYNIIPKKKINIRNYVLLFFSILFYFYGEPKLIIFLFISIFINYLLGLFMNKKNKKALLIIAILFNLSLLVYFKYTNFFVDNLDNIFNLQIAFKKVLMPIGISFYTFQSMSYVIDVYRNLELKQKNFFSLALYISMFPQLIAGPIVRYEHVAKQIEKREHSLSKASIGFDRFMQGLAKKVLFANSFAVIADYAFSLGTNELTILMAWMGSIAYTLQIYYDFSGYSDMAIGLGKIFGFDFLENFNYPYMSKSITEFWRRWHISLSSWFRDYVYIPLGGNRKGAKRQILNIFIVWFLTGFWHGASWNFMIWGLYFAFLLIIEKNFLLDKIKKAPKIIGHIYTMFLINIGFIIFRSNDISQITSFIKTMFGFGNNKFDQNIIYFLKQYHLIIIFGLIFVTNIISKIFIQKEDDKERKAKVLDYIRFLLDLLILVYVTILLLQNTYNPFIYFRF